MDEKKCLIEVRKTRLLKEDGTFVTEQSEVHRGNMCCERMREFLQYGCDDMSMRIGTQRRVSLGFSVEDDESGNEYSGWIDIDYCPFCGAEFEFVIVQMPDKKRVVRTEPYTYRVPHTTFTEETRTREVTEWVLA